MAQDAPKVDPKIQKQLDAVDAVVNSQVNRLKIVELTAEKKVLEKAVMQLERDLKSATQAGNLDFAIALKAKKDEFAARVDEIDTAVKELNMSGGEKEKAAAKQNKKLFLAGKWTFYAGGQETEFIFGDDKKTQNVLWPHYPFVLRGKMLEVKLSDTDTRWFVAQDKDTFTCCDKDGHILNREKIVRKIEK